MQMPWQIRDKPQPPAVPKFDARKITEHAVQRFSERVRQPPPGIAKMEMMRCLATGSPKLLKQLANRRKRKRTLIIPTGCCLFVFSNGSMVTVLSKDMPGKRAIKRMLKHGEAPSRSTVERPQTSRSR